MSANPIKKIESIKNSERTDAEKGIQINLLEELIESQKRR
jgi:hypothetical protein